MGVSASPSGFERGDFAFFFIFRNSSSIHCHLETSVLVIEFFHFYICSANRMLSALQTGLFLEVDFPLAIGGSLLERFSVFIQSAAVGIWIAPDSRTP